MIDKSKIPEQTLKELITLFGEEKAKKILERESYNFRSISLLIIQEKFYRRFGIRLEIFILIIGAIATFLYYIFW